MSGNNSQTFYNTTLTWQLTKVALYSIRNSCDVYLYLSTGQINCDERFCVCCHWRKNINFLHLQRHRHFFHHRCSGIVMITIAICNNFTMARFGYDTNFTKLLGGVQKNSSGQFNFYSFTNSVIDSSPTFSSSFIFPSDLDYPINRPHCVSQD